MYGWRYGTWFTGKRAYLSQVWRTSQRERLHLMGVVSIGMNGIGMK